MRKAYGAGLYAMCGPAFEPDACLALPTAWIAVMGPEAAVNAVYFNKIKEQPEAERAAYVENLRNEYRQDVDLYKLAAEMVVDDIVQPLALRQELINRFNAYSSKQFSGFKRNVAFCLFNICALVSNRKIRRNQFCRLAVAIVPSSQAT